ncbi:MAG: alanine--tRNA ligase [Neomegalonema sp.]|nr:alanine--tRNA ligase [Neomegalonema sp.]
MASLNDIRATFLDFFEKNDHEIVPSSSLVPRNDPTLLFTNAGMVQFKNVFTGVETRPYQRATTSQKVVRAGGKHNDLDNVGYTARHHTFFEMLGNFSFGDYFKEQAIPLAWDLITKEYGLPADKLLVTVYHEDEDAAAIWKKVAGLPDERIIRIATSDNFWSMGATGPCGPCSEIFFDHGPHIPGGPPGSPDEDGDRFIEIWNLVFMQYEQYDDGRRENLPKPSIDTGMGLERVGAVLQGKHDNYDTDLMRALIEAAAGAAGTDPDGPGKTHHRVIADHLRSSAFLIADGVMPSNEGRGYVLRRIMRRAMRHAHLLGAEEPLMWKLTKSLVAQMGQAFPELGRAQGLIEETLRLEETRFRKTLDRGLKLLEDELGKIGDGQPLPGDAAFKLYDTYGFPLDLTQDALREKGRSVDVAGFEGAMNEQKARARAAWSGSGEAGESPIWFDLREEHGPTEFLGYDTLAAEGRILALVVDGKARKRLKKGEKGGLVANQTPFYAESGGQQADHGALKTDKGEATITDVRKLADGVFVHMIEVTKGEVRVEQSADFAVAPGRRNRIRANHSATHLLHEALRRALGDHVAQRGSMVAADRLRFDFAHGAAPNEDELRTVETEVNDYIRQNGEVTTRVMTPDEAQELGARALFGEKYGDEVRVVAMGQRIGDAINDATAPKGGVYSLELCGGTHVTRTGEIGLLKIVNESASSAGVRRVEAVTGADAFDYLETQDKRLRSVAGTLKAAPEEALARVEGLLEERRQLQGQVADLRKKLAMAEMGGGESGGAAAKEVHGVKFFAQALTDVSPKDLRGLIDEHKKRLGSGVVLLIADAGGKAAAAAGVTEDLTAKISAVDVVRAAAEALGGKGGGGRPDMAQAGGADPSKSGEAITAAEKALADTLTGATA